MSDVDFSSDTNDHREQRRKKREERIVDRFRTSSKGLRRVFEKHFEVGDRNVEAAVFHLASIEAKFDSMREAIRLARYPGAGDRNAPRFAMGLWENLSILHSHLGKSMDALEQLVRHSNGSNDGEHLDDGDGEHLVDEDEDDDEEDNSDVE